MSKITFIIYGDINQSSGGYYYDREFVKALEKSGYCLNIADALKPDDMPDDTDLYIIDELCHPDFYRKHHFNRLRSGVPVAAMIHHLAADEDLSYINRIHHLRMERLFFKYIDFAVFNSHSTEESRINKGGYTGPYEIAVPGRIDEVSEQKVKERGENTLSLVFLGNLIPRKGLHHMIKHLSACNEIPFNLTIAGDQAVDPSYSRKLMRMVKQYKLNEKIKFTGYVSESAKEKLLKDSDILLVPSSHEGYGIVYIEAMRFGVIPVAGNSGGASEIINDGENGYIINPKDGICFRKILRELWNDAALMQRVSINAIRTWEKHPVWEQSFKPVIKKLGEIIL